MSYKQKSKVQGGPEDDPKLMEMILSNLYRLSIFFTGRFYSEFAVKWSLKIPPHLAYVAILPYMHTYIRLTALFSGTTRVSRYQKGKPIWILVKQETMSGSGISWAICKSAPRSRQITTPEPHRSVFTGRMPFLPPNQQRQSTEGTCETLMSENKRLTINRKVV